MSDHIWTIKGRSYSDLLEDYKIREGVTEVMGYWNTSKPVAHNAAGKCMTRFADLVIQDRKWVEAEFAKELKNEKAGQPKALSFCTRCLTELKNKPLVTVVPPALQVAETAAQAEKLADEIKAETAKESLRPQPQPRPSKRNQRTRTNA